MQLEKGQSRRVVGAHFCRIRDGGGAPPPPQPITFKDKTYPNKLYIIGKEIYRRLRFILDIDKIFWFRDFMSNFREITPQSLQKKIEIF